jgi:hypothetical protein
VLKQPNHKIPKKLFLSQKEKQTMTLINKGNLKARRKKKKNENPRFQWLRKTKAPEIREELGY